MKIEYQVCSLELSKRLKELNVSQESLFYHSPNPTNEGGYHINLSPFIVNKENCYSAYTVAELGEMLPSYYKSADNSVWLYHSGKSMKNNFYFVKYRAKSRVEIIKYDKNEANARSLMLIYLLENGLIENANNKL